jgi:MoaA/NifB/PqqE/SkfB family radical SAM enzyme
LIHPTFQFIVSLLDIRRGMDVMAASGFLPRHGDGLHCRSQFLTFVVPSPGGCNLACSFCLVRQRREIRPDHIGPDDLALFVRQAAERAPIFAIAIQGHEPLLPASLPYTKALLATGLLMGIPTSLVSNGVLLGDAIDLLSVLMPTKIAISLDADTAERHDRIRGVAGSWAATIEGIGAAVERLMPRTGLVVSSVLQSAKRQYLEGLPARLRGLGIDSWIVNPIIRVGRDDTGGPIGSRTKIFQDLLVLEELANRAGIRLTVDDEFDCLRHGDASARQPELRSLHVRTLPRGMEIFRLTPSGQCSLGRDILRRMTPDAPRWLPDTIHAGAFLEMISKGARLVPRTWRDDIQAIA